MKRVITILMAAVLAGSMSIAVAQTAGPGKGKGGGAGVQGGQRGPSGQGGGRARMQEMQKKIFDQLGLSAAQKTKIDALNKKYMADMEAMRGKQGQGGQPGANREKFQAMRKAHDESIKKVLTAAQLKKYEELRKKQMEEFRKQFGQGRGPGGPGAPAKGGAAGGSKGSKGGTKPPQ